MFIKSLSITRPDKKNERYINFHKGLNLIVDSTILNMEDDKKTGNNVGKTSVLKLINFCLGGDGEELYKNEKDKIEDTKVKSYLTDNKVLITLELIDSFEDTKETVKIERDFASGRGIRRINGRQIPNEKEYKKELLKILFKETESKRPTISERISHNIRYKEHQLTNILKTNPYQSDYELEALSLSMFGCKYEAERKIKLGKGRKKEETAKRKILNGHNIKEYEDRLNKAHKAIIALKTEKEGYRSSEQYEKDANRLEELNISIYELTKIINEKKFESKIIKEDLANYKLEKHDEKEMKFLYEEFIKTAEEIERKYQELVKYHNEMIEEKIKFIGEELPEIEREIAEKEKEAKIYKEEREEIQKRFRNYDSEKRIAQIEREINEANNTVGECNKAIGIVKDLENGIKKIDEQIKEINDTIYNIDVEKELGIKIERFNKYFEEALKGIYEDARSRTSLIMYTPREETTYKFMPNTVEISTGKLQGVILCFDIAYCQFADSEGIPCMHFLLNDRKELLHDNQLKKINEYLSNKNIQLVFSILRDKLPEELNKEENIILELSQEEKLFKIEQDPSK